ncbi:MAG: redox-regulated ATPase YchF [Deltaproteobacteria bacterium]|nr:redox-regulated ATPase YchF [Deltaproteobacteria bacterium]
MKIGLIGLPNSGKTTIFNALTRSDAQVAAWASREAETHVAVIEVADERVTRLQELYHPRKTTYPTIELVDFSGFSAGVSRKEGFSQSFLALIKTMDALAIVVRNFENDRGEAPEPLAELDLIATEFVLSDLIITETRLARIEEWFSRGKKTQALEREKRLLHRVEEALNENRFVGTIPLAEDEGSLISGFQFLTKKPLMVILNSNEGNFGMNEGLIRVLREKYLTVEFAGTFEMELNSLDHEERSLFMADMGIEESARDRLTRAAYEVLGYISFLTVGTDEVRAWTIRRGETALQAAGTIHSDLARGFIRAECFSYDSLIACGSEKSVRDQGRFRLEGKDYVVKDGDILSIRFSV